MSRDMLAGTIVAIMLVPQAMAYALLAGLPPEVGLYASIAPLIVYGLLGTSRTLAVGPVAMVSLLVVGGVSALAPVGSAEYVRLALTLALMVGVMQTAMGLLRLGFMVNFLSHPVLIGFTSAAAIVIGFSQIKHLLGISPEGGETWLGQLPSLAAALPDTNWATLAVGGGAIAVLLFFKYGVVPLGQKMGMADSGLMPLSKIGPLAAVAVATVMVWAAGLDQSAGVAIVGDVPAGLPALQLPVLSLSVWRNLLPTALAISLVGYMESISVAKSLAAKRREKIEPDQELIALGMANFAAAATGGYPVTGGISRSVVNFTAGAQTGVASVVTAVLVLGTVWFLTPIFFFMPTAALAAIILVAVATMVDARSFFRTWRYSRGEGVAFLVTFVAVLVVGVEMGILYGAAAALITYIYRISQPHMAIVGRLDGSEIYRNVLRHDVSTRPDVLALRVDESLFFGNIRAVETMVTRLIAERPEVKAFVLIGTAINHIDVSALEALEQLYQALSDSGVEFHLAAIKGPVLDQLRSAGFIDHFGEARIHETTHAAMGKINNCEL